VITKNGSKSLSGALRIQKRQAAEVRVDRQQRLVISHPDQNRARKVQWKRSAGTKEGAKMPPNALNRRLSSLGCWARWGEIWLVKEAARNAV